MTFDRVCSALIGGFWLIYLLGCNLSIASAIGFIALAGVAAEFGVVMLIYVNQSIARREREGRLKSLADLREANEEGAALRVRPLAMTVAVVIAGLLPIMFGSGTGSEVTRRIAALTRSKLAPPHRGAAVTLDSGPRSRV